MVNALNVGGFWSISGFVGKHQCFKYDVSIYRKPVEGAQGGVGCSSVGLTMREEKDSRLSMVDHAALLFKPQQC